MLEVDRCGVGSIRGDLPARAYALAMGTVGGRRPGRPAAASREDVIEAATARFQAGERVDMQALARELGLARATLHRWFGTREELLGETLATLAAGRLAAIREQVGGEGAPALLLSFDRFNRELASNEGLRALLEAERERALQMLTSSGALVQPRMVAAVGELIEAEVQSGTYAPDLPSETLAYAIVRLAESFIYSDARFGIRGDTERLKEVEAALLGLSPRAI